MDRGFFSKLEFDDAWIEQVTQSEMARLLSTRASRDRFESMLATFDNKLRLLSEKDQPPQYVIIGLPSEVVHRCGVIDYHDKSLGMLHRDLRRCIKTPRTRHPTPTPL